MATYKYIYWRPDMRKNKEGLRFANVHYLIGYNQGSVVDYFEMARELQNTFPQASIADIHCGKVIKSSFCQGFSLVTFNAHIPEGEYEGWQQYEPRVDGTMRQEYNWV